MSRRIEKLLKEYPQMVQTRNCLAYQLAHFKGLTAEEVIESMYTPRQDGERVQTSNLSDKTAQIALDYQTRREQMNREWYSQMEQELCRLNDEVVFLESALRSLPGTLSAVMWDIVVEQMKWDAVENKHAISHTTLYRQRRRAISELDKLYEKHEHDMIAYMLD